LPKKVERTSKTGLKKLKTNSKSSLKTSATSKTQKIPKTVRKNSTNSITSNRISTPTKKQSKQEKSQERISQNLGANNVKTASKNTLTTKKSSGAHAITNKHICKHAEKLIIKWCCDHENSQGHSVEKIMAGLRENYDFDHELEVKFVLKNMVKGGVALAYRKGQQLTF